MKPRSLCTVVALLVLATGLGACGNKEELRDEVLAALRRTDGASYKFVYVDDRVAPVFPGAPKPPPDLEVQGLVEDDFRFKARVVVDETPAFDEVVSDDILAMRFLDPGRLESLVNPAKVAEADTKTDLEGIDSMAALRSKRWVLDDTAAPIVTVGRVRESTLGEDPVLDAITVLTYVETAIREALAVEKYSADDVAPAYTTSEDDFPKPEEGSGVTRYDLRRPKLPPPGNTAGVGSSARPQTRHFRRMAIYVKDGVVIQVRETVDVRGKFINEVVKYAKSYAKASGASEQEIGQFESILEDVPDAERGALVLDGMNLALTSTGDDPILQRQMRLELREVGDPVDVELPSQDVIKGGLGFLTVTAQGKAEDEEGGSAETGDGAPTGAGTAGGGADTTTSAPGASPEAGSTEPTADTTATSAP